MDSKTLDALTSVLSDSDATENIKNMFSALTGATTQPKENSTSADISENGPDSQIPDINFLANILSGNEQSVIMMNKMKKAYDSFKNANDPSINLINALSPYLSSRRAMNANKLITAVKISKAVNIFKEE